MTRPRTFADPRSWWCCWPARDWPTALPSYLARAWRRRGRPVVYGTHEQACAWQRRLRARSAEAVAPARLAEPPRAAVTAARRDGQGQFSLFGTEAAA